jgi:hypothetical protein
MRSIATALTHLDRSLCEFEQWARGREIQSVLHVEKNDLSVSQREKLLVKIKQIRGVILNLYDTLKLEKNVQIATAAIWSECAALRVPLIEIETKYLARYGDMPVELAAHLDSKIEDIIKDLEGISSIVKTE